MLLDHIGYCLPRAGFSPYFRIIGRLAFPIFVFLVVNGYRYTRSKPKYALRLAIFAVISQIPFSLMQKGTLFYPTGNVFVTLLLSLLCVWFAAEFWSRSGWWRLLAFVPAVIVCGLYYFGYLNSDYGMKGILLALVLYFFDGKYVLTAIGTFVSLFAPTLIGYGINFLQMLRGRAYAFRLPGSWTMTEAYALLALIPVFLYHGKKGRTPENKVAAKAMQLAFYAFYPVHMLILALLFRLS